jgi:hypothetical protein
MANEKKAKAVARPAPINPFIKSVSYEEVHNGFQPTGAEVYQALGLTHGKEAEFVDTLRRPPAKSGTDPGSDQQSGQLRPSSTRNDRAGGATA